MQQQPSHYSVVIPAAGSGKRMQQSQPKQYIKLGDRTIIEHTVDVFLKHPKIGKIVVVLSAEDQIFSTLPIAQHPKVQTCIGGNERADSVLAGLQQLDEQDQWVLVHDAARPCLCSQDLDKLLNIVCAQKIGGILASPVKDTMKRSNRNGEILHTEPRDNLWHALTPQLFPTVQLVNALQSALDNAVIITDEASAIEYMGGKVTIVQGKASNLKVTQPDDLRLAEYYLQVGANHDN